MSFGRVQVMVVGALLAGACASTVDVAPVSMSAAQTARGLDCTFLTEAEAAASAGVPNVTHEGVRLVPQPPPSTDPNDAIAQRANIPRSAQPALTARLAAPTSIGRAAWPNSVGSNFCPAGRAVSWPQWVQ